MKKTLWIVVAIVVVVLIVVGVSKKGAESDTIKIGGSVTLTGPVAAIGTLQKNVITMAVDEINAAGGINGKKVELILEDNGYDPKMAINSYQALKLKGAKYIVADGSPVVGSIRPLVIKDGNFIFAPVATTPGYFDGSDLSCRIALTSKNFGPGFAQLLGKKGYKNVVVLLPDNEYGRGLSDEFNKAYTANGGKILATEFYDATAAGGDYRTNLTKLKAFQSTADAMVFVQAANTIEPMLKQIHELGWKKALVSDYYTLVQNPALKDLSLANGIDFVDYTYSRDTLPTDSDAVKTFKANYTAKYGSSPVLLVAANYDVVKLIAEAIKNAGDDPQKVGDYISHLQNYQGITGTLSFNSDCEVSRDMVFRSVVDGKVVDLK